MFKNKIKKKRKTGKIIIKMTHDSLSGHSGNFVVLPISSGETSRSSDGQMVITM